jgi:hypothetical protein
MSFEAIRKVIEVAQDLVPDEGGNQMSFEAIRKVIEVAQDLVPDEKGAVRGGTQMQSFSHATSTFSNSRMKGAIRGTQRQART